MSSTLQPLRLAARSVAHRDFIYHSRRCHISKQRYLSCSSSKSSVDRVVSNKKTTNQADLLKTINDSNEAVLDLLDTAPWRSKVAVKNEESEIDLAGIGASAPTLEKQKKKKAKDTFLNLGDPEGWEDDGQLEDDHDDITTLGHGELERHREMRHYARLAAWEMPLLSKFAKPFEPPTKETPLRFRYTSYMGEKHPAEKKVVVEFSPADMPNLSDTQREKLKKLVGVRYIPDKDVIKMSCESFETQAQNKRYLGDLIDSLLHESKTGDSFEDIPLDLRHHRVKTKPKFPKEWALTNQRRNDLFRIWDSSQKKDKAEALGGDLMDGLKHIEDGITRAALVKVAPDMAVEGKGRRRLTVRR